MSATLSYLAHFLRLSLVSGLDVARRALSATPDLEPGMVEARLRQPPGFARNAFSVIASLLPGSLLTGFDPEDEQRAYVHALDVRQPVAAELAAEEASFLRTLGHDWKRAHRRRRADSPDRRRGPRRGSCAVRAAWTG